MIISLLQLISSCSNNKIETKVIKSLERNCRGDTCTVNLNELTEFDWDKVYIFDDWSTPEKISKTIGIEYKKNNHFPDGYHKMIFVKASEIVHEEEFGGNSDQTSSINILYPIDTVSYSQEKKSYTNVNSYVPKNQAIFFVRKVKIKGSCNSCFMYELTPLINFGKTLSY